MRGMILAATILLGAIPVIAEPPPLEDFMHPQALREYRSTEWQYNDMAYRAAIAQMVCASSGVQCDDADRLRDQANALGYQMLDLQLQSWQGKKPIAQAPVIDTARPELQQEYYRLRQEANQLGTERAIAAAKCKTEPEYCHDAERLSQDLNRINKRLWEIELQAWEEQKHN